VQDSGFEKQAGSNETLTTAVIAELNSPPRVSDRDDPSHWDIFTPKLQDFAQLISSTHPSIGRVSVLHIRPERQTQSRTLTSKALELASWGLVEFYIMARYRWEGLRLSPLCVTIDFVKGWTGGQHADLVPLTDSSFPR
jgi:hypothetical protein